MLQVSPFLYNTKQTNLNNMKQVEHSKDTQGIKQAQANDSISFGKKSSDVDIDWISNAVINIVGMGPQGDGGRDLIKNNLNAVKNRIKAGEVSVKQVLTACTETGNHTATIVELNNPKQEKFGFVKDENNGTNYFCYRNKDFIEPLSYEITEKQYKQCKIADFIKFCAGRAEEIRDIESPLIEITGQKAQQKSKPQTGGLLSTISSIFNQD